MPIPSPRDDESEDEFISRCVSSMADTDPDMPNSQRVAICYGAWRDAHGEQTLPKQCVCRSCGYVLENPDKHCIELKCPKCGGEMRRREQPTRAVDEAQNMHSDFMKILQDFISFFKDKGREKFDAFLKAYRLDPSQSYSSQITRECVNGYCESFQWAKPMIQYLKKDDGGRYYKLRALTATVSMNQNDYTGDDPTFNETKLQRSARTLTYRPININHDRKRWLKFPENRVDWAEYEDRAAECIIRIDNKQADIQHKIESGEIVNPSIEARPIGDKTVDGRLVPEAWNFTALALLEKDVTLPGVPTTLGIEPLFLNEDMAQGLVESLRVEKTKEKTMNETTEAEWNPSADWPDSCYMHVPAEAKGAEGKKSLRKLPYKYPSGEIDCPHVLAIIQVAQGGRGGVDLPDDLKAKYLSQAQTIYKRECNPDYEPEEGFGVEFLRYDDEQHMKNKALDALKEYFGINGLSICGQCKFFEMKEATTTKTPAATGDGVKTDAFNTLTVGNIGLGVGVCEVASKLKGREITVKHTDWACAEGRPRDTPAYGNRGTQNASFNEQLEAKALEAAYNKKLEEKEEKLLEKDNQIIAEKREKAEARADIAALQEKLSHSEQEKNRLEHKLTSLTEDRVKMREQIDELQDTITDMEVKANRLEDDKTYGETQVHRLKEQVTELKNEVMKYKAEAERLLVEKNDEAVKRSAASQQAANDRDAKIRVLEENSILNKKLADAQRKITDLTDHNASASKDHLDEVMENQKLRAENREQKDELTKLHRLVNDLKEQLRKRPKKIEVRV